MRLLLASKSPARRTTLENAGIAPLIAVSNVDEAAVLKDHGISTHIANSDTPDEQSVSNPARHVSILAQAKCSEIISHILTPPYPEHFPDLPHEDILVVGCDSMLELDGRMLGKPHTPEVARERIREMRNRCATLWTGHTLAHISAPTADLTRKVLDIRTEASSTIVHFADMSDQEIDAYVASGEPLKVAGSFTVDGLGGPFISGIEGDYHAVVGISLPLLRVMAQDMGIFWPSLWIHNNFEGIQDNELSHI